MNTPYKYSLLYTYLIDNIQEVTTNEAIIPFENHSMNTMIDDESFQHPTIQPDLPDGENEFIISTVATESSPSNDGMMDCSKQNQCAQVEAKNISDSTTDTYAQHRPCAQNTSDNMYHHSSIQQNINVPGVYV